MAFLTLEEVKNDLRIDQDFDDTYITRLLETSKLVIDGSIEVDINTLESDARIATLQFMLVSLWYENRVSATQAMLQQVPFTINALIHQLRGVTQ